jgi:hypothetical protein
VPDGELQGNTTAEGIAHDVGLLKTKPNKGGAVVCHQLEAQGAIDVGISAMSLQVDGDDAASLLQVAAGSGRTPPCHQRPREAESAVLPCGGPHNKFSGRLPRRFLECSSSNHSPFPMAPQERGRGLAAGRASRRNHARGKQTTTILIYGSFNLRVCAACARAP